MNRLRTAPSPDDTMKSPLFRRFKIPTLRKRAPNSPRKTRAVLDRLEKPVLVHIVPPMLVEARATLPADILALFQQIQMVNARHMIIPHELQEVVAELISVDPFHLRSLAPARA